MIGVSQMKLTLDLQKSVDEAIFLKFYNSARTVYVIWG